MPFGSSDHLDHNRNRMEEFSMSFDSWQRVDNDRHRMEEFSMSFKFGQCLDHNCNCNHDRVGEDYLFLGSSEDVDDHRYYDRMAADLMSVSSPNHVDNYKGLPTIYMYTLDCHTMGK